MTSRKDTLTGYIRLAVGLPLLAAVCIGSLLWLYGGDSPQSAARLEAGRLAMTEVSELIGTDAYERAQSTPEGGLTAMSQVFHLPFADTVGMLTSELPTALGTTVDTSSQSSLSASLRHWQAQTKKITLGWVQNDTSDHIIQMIQENPGLTVISPKWLMVKNAAGEVQTSIQPRVVEYAHSQHIQVWALLDNQFNAKLTHQVLSNPNTRRALVRHVVEIAKTRHLDGINVDFENVKPDDRDAFSAFIHELHTALQPAHINLSVDVTPDIVYLHDEAAFFHAGLAADCDEIIVMAYDEHWGGDQEPGPVADVPWVTEAVEDLLNTGVPADKLVLGLPFYTEFWYVHSDGSVQSEAVKTSAVPGILQAHGAKPVWDDKLGVMYAKYPKEDGYMEVWYETDETLARKLQLVNDEGLAGIAIWSLSLSDKHTWSTVVEALRQTLS